MKRLITLTLLTMFTAILFTSNAPLPEEEKKYIYLNVHEDLVIPSKMFEYEAACKKLKEYCEKHNIQDAEWATISLSDFRYLHINEIDKLGDLDSDYFAGLEEKVGKEAMDQLWDEFDQCYTTHRNFTVALNLELSYMPDGMEISMDEMPYRRYEFIHFDAKDADDMMEVAKDINSLHKEVNSPLHYRVFRSGYGEMGPYLLIVMSAKDAIDLETRMAKAKDLMSDKRMEILKKALDVMTGYEEISGRMRPELSYGVVDISNEVAK